MEYRVKEDSRSYRNRNLLTLKLDRQFTPWNLSPYLADEVFYDLTESLLARNRFYIACGQVDLKDGLH